MLRRWSLAISWSWFLGFELLEQGIEALVVTLPQPAVAFQPLGSLPQPLGLEAARPPLRVAAARNQAGALQYLQVLGDRRLAHRERLGQLRHRRLTRRQAGEDRPPGGIGEGREDGVEAVRCVHNLLVIYGITRLPSSPRLSGDPRPRRVLQHATQHSRHVDEV